MVSVSDATQLPKIYARQANKSDFYIAGAFGKEETVFNMQDWKQHAKYRKYLAGPYGMGSVRRMEGLVDGFVDSWTARVEGLFSKGVKFDFVPWATYLAYDVIASIGFGGPFGFIAEGKDVGGLIKGITDGLPMFGMAARLYPVTYWAKSTALGSRLLIPSSKDKSGFGTLMRFRDELYEKRLVELRENKEAGRENGRVDLLQTMLEARTEEGEPLRTDYIKVETLLLLLAGAETVGTAFQGFVVMVLTTPGVYEKLIAEIDQVVQDGKVSDPPQYDEIVACCPYYVACIKEALRVYPPINNQFPRIVGPGGLKIGEYLIPEGAEVACNSWIIHRDPVVFGADAEKYRPERWLEDEDKTKYLERHILTFGWGSRICLGKDIAMMELYKGPFQVSSPSTQNNIILTCPSSSATSSPSS